MECCERCPLSLSIDCHWSHVYFPAHKSYYKKHDNCGSLSVGHYELCRDDIGDLPGSPEHL